MNNVQSEMTLDLEGAMAQLTAPVCTDEVFQEYREKMRIDPCNINEEFLVQPELMLDAVNNCGQAQNEADYWKDMLDGAAAYLDPQVRGMLTTAGSKPTVAAIESAIKTQSGYREILALYHAAKSNAAKWKAIVEAAKNRKDALITVASNYRAEGGADLSMKTPEHLKEKALEVLRR